DAQETDSPLGRDRDLDGRCRPVGRGSGIADSHWSACSAGSGVGCRARARLPSRHPARSWRLALPRPGLPTRSSAPARSLRRAGLSPLLSWAAVHVPMPVHWASEDLPAGLPLGGSDPAYLRRRETRMLSIRLHAALAAAAIATGCATAAVAAPLG